MTGTKSPSIMTERMGPIEQRDTSPKLPLSVFFPWPMEEKSHAQGQAIKGTVGGPVVTPPEPKATAQKITWEYRRPG